MPEKGLLQEYQPKIEMLRCPNNKNDCIPQLPVINQYFKESQLFLFDKDYKHSIDTLRQAYTTTLEITDSSCDKCADLFRLNIISSLENIHSELHKITSGWFKAKRYRSDLEQVTKVLKEYKTRKECLPDHHGFNIHEFTDTGCR